MALDNVFTGANGTLTLAHEDTPEGADASAIMDSYTLQAVGRVTNVEVYVQTDLEEFYQIGRRHPVSLHAANIHIGGKVGRAYVNGALLWLLMGRGASPNNIAEPYAEPAFNMSILLSDPEVAGNSVALELKGVKFQNWAYALPEDDFVMENATFKALSIRVIDKEAPSGGGQAAANAPKFPTATA